MVRYLPTDEFLPGRDPQAEPLDDVDGHSVAEAGVAGGVGQRVYGIVQPSGKL